ncbi:MAG TPA: YbaB/EbfC family nucleoid-associated protein [Terriglobales bacterium]|nr:YbaB/EbfC family nucleoid-associated protein [Terriglobales bacterium]
MGSFNPNQLQDLIGQARRQYEDLQKKMRETVVEGTSGGGVVAVRMNGQKHVLKVTIDPETVKSGDIEMLQDLITAAVNAAGNKVDGAMQSTVGGMFGGGLSGLFGG